jgi:hypothetical protein
MQKHHVNTVFDRNICQLERQFRHQDQRFTITLKSGWGSAGSLLSALVIRISHVAQHNSSLAG